MDGRHQGSSVHVRVADSADENAWRRHAINIFTIHKGYAFGERVDFNHDWAAGFTAEKPCALAEDAEAVVSGACGYLLLFDGAAVDVIYDVH